MVRDPGFINQPVPAFLWGPGNSFQRSRFFSIDDILSRPTQMPKGVFLRFPDGPTMDPSPTPQTRPHQVQPHDHAKLKTTYPNFSVQVLDSSTSPPSLLYLKTIISPDVHDELGHLGWNRKRKDVFPDLSRSLLGARGTCGLLSIETHNPRGPVEHLNQ